MARAVLLGPFVNEREGRLRAGWRVLAFCLLVVVLVLVLAAAGAALGTAGVEPATVGFLGQVAGNLLVGGGAIAAAWGLDRRTVRDLGLGGPSWWRNLGTGLVVGFAMTTTVFLVELAAGLVAVDGFFLTRPGVGTSWGFPVALGLTAVLFVVVGWSEELVVRGYLLTNVAEGLAGAVGSRAAVALAVVLTSGLFGALHLANPNATAVSALNIAVVGAFLAWTFVASGDLGIPVGVHVAWNFAISSVYGFPVSGVTTSATVLAVEQTGPRVLTGGRFGPEAGLVVYAGLAVGVVLAWAGIRSRDGGVDPTAVAEPDLRAGASATPGAEGETAARGNNRDR